MRFSVGQHVCHPSYGPGKIIDIDEQTIQDAPQDYYVLRIMGQEMTTYIPVDAIEKIGLRSVISKKQTDKILVTLQEEPEMLPKDHQRRQSKLKELIFSGRPVKVAQAVRELTWRRFRKGKLNEKDKQLFEQGKDMLVAEFAIARNTEQTSALKLINSALWSALEERQEAATA